MNCTRIGPKLPLYAGGELSDRELEEVRAHLQTCAACREEAAALAAMDEQVRASWSEEVPVPETLDARVMRAVRETQTTAPRRGFAFQVRALLPRTALAAALVALCLLAVPRLLPSRSLEEARVFDLTSLRAEHQQPQGQLTTGSPSELEAKLAPLVSFPVRAVDLSPEDTHLVSGAETRLQGAPVASFQYEWNGTRVSLFQMDARRLAPKGLGQMPTQVESYVAQRKDGVSYVAWRSGGVGNVLVAQAMPMHRLFQLACHACERQEKAARQTL